MNTKTQQLAELVKQSKNIVFFGGAGVSTESGIQDFRSEIGLFAAQKAYGYPPHELLSCDFFMREQTLFFRYYKENMIAIDAKPNAAHFALAKLEAQGLLQAIITQNIDGLHQRAGSQNVLELHGSNYRQYCMDCGTKYSLEYALLPANCRDEIVPLCEKCGGVVRPDVVLYGENLNESVLSAAVHAIEAADLLIVGGTSLVVYPAAGLLRYFRGEHIVLINKSETQYDERAQLVIRESIGKVLGEAVEAFFNLASYPGFTAISQVLQP